MKKILTSFIFSLTVLTSFTQVKSEASEHMTFKGVPIDGTLNEFVAKMKQSGFTHISTEDGIAILEGDFAAYKGCIVGVSSLKQKDLVSKVTVVFSERESWTSLSNHYFTLKELLTEKYGEPTDYEEKFLSSYPPEDDNDKMYEVRMKRCNYYTTYETEKGRIHLSIDHDEVVLLTYYDKINSDILREKALDDL